MRSLDDSKNNLNQNQSDLEKALADLTKANREQKLGDINKYGDLEVGGTFLGFVCIRDPPRDEVR